MYWLKRIFQKERTERELDSELQFHVEQRTAEIEQSGVPVAEARRLARLEFGGVEGVKQECRESRRVHFLETLLQDIRHGVRMMRRSPGFTAVAILTLALGIGANSAIFSVVNGVLLNPLPFPDSDRLVGLHESKQNFERGSVSYPNFLDWKQENHSFSQMAIARNSGYNFTGSGDAEQLKGLLVSSEFFDLLGVKPVIGRTFQPGEDTIGAAPIVLLNAGLWQRRFGGSADILGNAITLDGRKYTIVGVIPASFTLSNYGFERNDVFVPIGQWQNPLLPNRAAGLGIHGFARLRPGVTLAEARSDMERLTRNLAAAYPKEDKGVGASLVPLREQLLGNIQPYLLVLLAAVGFVLLIACLNVANLLLARSTVRSREFAVRMALGASHTRLMRQVLTESVLLALTGGAIGLALSGWGVTILVRALSAQLPRADQVRLDFHVLLFTFLVSLLSGLIFGLAPAFKTARSDLARSIKDAAGFRNLRHRTQNILVVVEVAIALVLLVGAGLMIRCLTNLWQVDPGFNPHGALTFGLSLPPSMNSGSVTAIRAAYRNVNARLSTIAGVEASSWLWGAFPMQGDDEALFWMEGQPRPTSPNDMNWSLRYVVGPDYLKAMGIPLKRGRFLDAHDDEHSPHVAVVDEVFAAKFFPNSDPLGKRINLDDDNGFSNLTEIVGVVKHVKQWGLDRDDGEALRAQLYLPFMQLPDPAMKLAGGGTGVVVRFKGDPAPQFETIRAVLRQMNAEQVVYAPQTMDQIISASLSPRRYLMLLLGAFAALALLLASVGIYGVVSYVVGQRTQEIGIRMALGAKRMDVLRLIIVHGFRLVFAGLGLGVAAALLLTRLMAQLLFGISASDPATFVAVGILLAIVALAACAGPARRATLVDPIVALRHE